MTLFHLPDLGEGLGEAEIVTWHVASGDHVVADQPLVSVETDKAVVEIPSPQAGRISELHGEPGDVVQVGDVLVSFSDDPGAGQSVSVVGEIPDSMSGDDGSPAPVHSPARGRASPAVRTLARRLGVDLAPVFGTGPAGTISRADVEAAAAAANADGPKGLRGTRRAMARNMVRAHAQVVPATLTDVADIDAWESSVDVTVRLVRAIGAGCTAEPHLNAWFVGVDEGLSLHQNVDIGVATDTADGLFVPVLRNTTARDAADLRAAIERMKADLMTRSIPARELRDPTITLSNFGMLGGQHAALVVMPPQVAILGAGRARRSVVARDGQVVVRRTLPLSLTFDHRAVTGGEAARFLAAVGVDLERSE